MSTTRHYDIAIVGAGMVGAALACALGDTGLRVALIEARAPASQWPAPPRGVVDFDPRVSALTPASRDWLDTLGVWSPIEAYGVGTYRHMRVWDAEGTGAIGFDADQVNQPALGYIVENRVATAALLQRLAALPAVHLLAPESLQTLTPEGDGYRLELASGAVLQASLLVAADGGRSEVRRQAGVPVREWDYGHHAIVTTVACERPHAATAWQRFLPEGPLAFLPLADIDGDARYCSIVWSAVSERAEALMQLSDTAFCRELGAAFEHRLGAVTACSTRFSFPLQQRHATRYVQPGLALVGDAAHTIHPLAGQGANLGLSDAAVLAGEIRRAVARGLDPGLEAVLLRYQRRRKGDNLGMMLGMEGFKRLFEQDHLALRWARNAGMRWLDQCAPLKRRIARKAMGL